MRPRSPFLALLAATGCVNSICDLSGEHVTLFLVHAEFRDNDIPGDILSATGDEDEAAELFAEMGVEVAVPSIAARRQLLIYQGEIRHDLDLPIFTSAEEIESRLVLRVNPGTEVEHQPDDRTEDTGATYFILSVWIADSTLPPATCGD